jgi:hypothetical protein
METPLFVPITKYCSGNQVNEDEMAEVCGTCVGEEGLVGIPDEKRQL